MSVLRKCEHCNKEFHTKPSNLNRGWGRFCSKSCAAKVRNLKHKQYLNLKPFKLGIVFRNTVV